MKKRAFAICALAGLAALAAVAAAGGRVFEGKRPPDLQAAILPAMPEVYVGKKMVYNVLVSNVGGLDATGVTVDIGVAGGDPKMFKLAFNKVTCAYASETTVTCAGALAHGRTAKIRVGIRPETAGHMTLTASVNAIDDSDASNNDARENTPVRPGRPGPPKVGNEDGPHGATPHEDLATVDGRFHVSEAATVTLSVVDLTVGGTIPMAPGTEIASVATQGSNVAVTVGDGDHADTAIEAPKVIYKIQLPKDDLKPDHTYAVVTKAVDKEGENSNDVKLSFKLKKK